MWPLIRFRISFSRGCKGIPYYFGVLSHMSDPFQGPRPRRLSGSSWRSCSLPSDLLPWRQQSEKKEMMDRFLTLTCLKLAAGFSYRLGSSLHPKKNVLFSFTNLTIMIFFLLLYLKCNSDVLKVKKKTLPQASETKGRGENCVESKCSLGPVFLRFVFKCWQMLRVKRKDQGQTRWGFYPLFVLI